ncbi:hypothetical protein NMY22_g19431 [Coprinellus aureogranulatus]|nr:hypothetical protein NMY22_g19431 [Coprinellus aureogranulatus]
MSRLLRLLYKSNRPSFSTDFDSLDQSNSTTKAECHPTGSVPAVKRTLRKPRPSGNPVVSVSTPTDIQEKSSHIIPPVRKSSLVPQKSAISQTPQPSSGSPVTSREAATPRGSSNLPKRTVATLPTRARDVPSKSKAAASASVQPSSSAIRIGQIVTLSNSPAADAPAHAAQQSSNKEKTLSTPDSLASTPPVKPSGKKTGSHPAAVARRQEESAASTSPLARLKMSILPPGSLMRSFSVSKQWAADTDSQHLLGRGGSGETSSQRVVSGGGVIAAGDNVDGVGEERKVEVESDEETGSVQAPKIVPKQVHVRSGARHGSRRGILGNFSSKRAPATGAPPSCVLSRRNVSN